MFFILFEAYNNLYTVFCGYEQPFIQLLAYSALQGYSVRNQLNIFITKKASSMPLSQTQNSLTFRCLLLTLLITCLNSYTLEGQWQLQPEYLSYTKQNSDVSFTFQGWLPTIGRVAAQDTLGGASYSTAFVGNKQVIIQACRQLLYNYYVNESSIYLEYVRSMESVRECRQNELQEIMRKVNATFYFDIAADKLILYYPSSKIALTLKRTDQGTLNPPAKTYEQWRITKLKGETAPQPQKNIYFGSDNIYTCNLQSVFRYALTQRNNIRTTQIDGNCGNESSADIARLAYFYQIDGRRMNVYDSGLNELGELDFVRNLNETEMEKLKGEAGKINNSDDGGVPTGNGGKNNYGGGIIIINGNNNNVLSPSTNAVTPSTDTVTPASNNVSTTPNTVTSNINTTTKTSNTVPQTLNTVPLTNNTIPSINTVPPTINTITQTPNAVTPTNNTASSSTSTVPPPTNATSSTINSVLPSTNTAPPSTINTVNLTSNTASSKTNSSSSNPTTQNNSSTSINNSSSPAKAKYSSTLKAPSPTAKTDCHCTSISTADELTPFPPSLLQNKWYLYSINGTIHNIQAFYYYFLIITPQRMIYYGGCEVKWSSYNLNKNTLSNLKTFNSNKTSCLLPNLDDSVLQPFYDSVKYINHAIISGVPYITFYDKDYQHVATFNTVSPSYPSTWS